MSARIQRLPPLVIAGVILAAGAAIGLAAAPHIHRLDPFAVVVLSMAGAVAAARLPRVVEPALILTAGMLLSVFSGNWGNIGIHIPLDRIAIFAGIAAAVFRSLLSEDRPAARTSPRALADGAAASCTRSARPPGRRRSPATGRCSRCSTDSA